MSLVAPVIERDWYDILAYGLDSQGKRAACGHGLSGVFDGPVGTQGLRVRLALTGSCIDA